MHYERTINMYCSNCGKRLYGIFVNANTARIYNRFGYSVVDIEKERGTMDVKAKECKYYLMDYKIYSNRFATDCFNGYFADKAMRTRIGINDYPEYKGVKATVDELHQQHSYFIEGMYKDEQGGDD